MKEALIIFIILLILLMIISVFGGSIRHTPSKFAGVPSTYPPSGVASGSIGGLGGSFPMPTAWEGFDNSAVKAPGAASSPTASSGSAVSSGTVGGTANLSASPAGNSMGAVTAQGGTSTSPAGKVPHVTPVTTVEPFGAPEFAPF